MKRICEEFDRIQKLGYSVYVSYNFYISIMDSKAAQDVNLLFVLTVIRDFTEPFEHTCWEAINKFNDYYAKL